MTNMFIFYSLFTLMQPTPALAFSLKGSFRLNLQHVSYLSLGFLYPARSLHSTFPVILGTGRQRPQQ